MPKSYVVEGTTYNFPDEMSDQQVHDVLLKQGVIKPPPAQHWSDTMGLTNPIARGVTDFAEGAASGLASTVFQGGDMIRRGLGMERVINRPEVQHAMTPPDSIPGQAGKFAEQTAEYLVPGGMVSKAAKGTGLLTRAAANSALGGTVAAVQSGGDPVATGTGAALGGVGEVIGGALDSSKLPQMLRESAEKGYARAINATKQGNKWVSQNIVVPELLDRGVSAFTLKGLKGKATNAVQGFGQAIDAAWKALPEGTTAELDPIWNTIESGAKDALTITTKEGNQIPTTAAAKQALDGIGFLKETLLGVAEKDPATGNLVVPVEKLRQLRQAWDEVAATAKVYQGANLADAATGKIHAMGADAIREQLAQDHPDIAALNKEFSFWKNVEKVVGDTVLRREGQAKPLGQKIAGAAGAAVGAHGGIPGAVVGKEAMEGLTAAMNSTAWRTVSAVQKNKLAEYLANGNRGGAEFTIRKIVKSVGLEAAIPTGQPSGQLSPQPAQ